MAMHSTQSSAATKKGTELHKKENRKTGKHIENMVRKTQQKKVPTNYRFTAAQIVNQRKTFFWEKIFLSLQSFS